MLAKGGAYSKRYQMEEREKVGQWCTTQNGRNARDREQALSKQTAQRQKALEQKKRAMAQAEEDRRRKALDERRQTQREATERCKMAITRMKGLSRSSNAQFTRDTGVEIHNSNLPKQARANHLPPPPPAPPPPPSSTTSLETVRKGERVVLGSEVELKREQLSCKRPPPPLDQVLQSIRGHSSSSPSPPLTTPAAGQPASAVQHEREGAEEGHTDPPLNRRNSDPNTVSQFPMYQVHLTKSERQSNSHDMTRNGSSQKPATAQVQEAYEVKVLEMEGMIFHPVVRGPPQARLEASHANHAMRIVSPSQCSSSSNSSSSPIDSLSGDDSPDSASGSAPTASSSSTVRRVVRKHRKSSKDAKKRESGKSHVAAVGALPGSSASSTLPKPSPKPSAQHTFADSSSEEDSTPAHFSPPRSRRQRKLPPGKSPGEEENHLQKYLESGTSSEPQELKIVGILKKSRGSSAASTIHSTDSEGRETRRWNGTENGLIGSALTSRASSANSVALEQRHGEREGYGLINGSRVSRDTITISSAGTTKRVRFSDNLESSTTSPSPAAQQLSTVSIKSSMELWKRVLPNSLCSRHSPSTIFSPKMKISLSQRGPMQKPPLPSDRITVHVPRGYEFLTQQPNGVKQESKTEGNGKSTTRATSDAEREGEAVHDSVAENEQNGEVIVRGQTPTDDQIDSVWDEIQSQLYGRERVSLAPKVYQFQPNPQTGGNATRVGERGLPYKHPQTQRHGNVNGDGDRESGPGGGGGGQNSQHLPQRPKQKPLRCQGSGRRGHTKMTPHQLWVGQAQQTHHPHGSHGYERSESSHMNAHPSSWEPRVAPQAKPVVVTGFSHDEQRLMRSIEKINQRLRDHVVVKDSSNPHPSHPPHHPSHPHSSHPPHHSSHPNHSSHSKKFRQQMY